jgi:hypothetical protein
MNQIIDILLILILKLLLLIGFLVAIKFWIKKTMNSIPFIIYWILGLFFVLMLSFQIFQYVLTSFSFPKNSMLGDESMIGSLCSILSILLYLFIGLKYLKRKKSF